MAATTAPSQVIAATTSSISRQLLIPSAAINTIPTHPATESSPRSAALRMMAEVLSSGCGSRVQNSSVAWRLVSGAYQPWAVPLAYAAKTDAANRPVAILVGAHRPVGFNPPTVTQTHHTSPPIAQRFAGVPGEPSGRNTSCAGISSSRTR